MSNERAERARSTAALGIPLSRHAVEDGRGGSPYRREPGSPTASHVNDLHRGRVPSIIETSIRGPQTHRLPFHIMWGINVSTAAIIALLNLAVVLIIEQLVEFKFRCTEDAMDMSVGFGCFVLVLISMGYASCMACVIKFIAPNCGGSGVPENKTYLNGGHMPGLYTKRTLFVRVTSNILANAAGFPVGREGPMVTIGSNIAFLLSRLMANPYVKDWVDVDRPGGTRAVLVDEQRLAHATRISCTVGGACAMTCIFNAPFGGLLYMFEEITSVSWPLELTFRVFVATMLSSIIFYHLCSALGSDITEFVIYAEQPQDVRWRYQDLIVFLFMSAVLGVITSYHTRALLWTAKFQEDFLKSLEPRHRRSAHIAEAVAYGGVCAIASCLACLATECIDEGTSGLQYVVFNCPDGQYNPTASLLIATSHSAVKLLFSGWNAGEIPWSSSFLAFLVYSTLNAGLGGLPVPGGAFTATMLMGALFGRTVGTIMVQIGYPAAVSGVYAVVGSAAMLCGFKQMTLASVLITIECVNDLSLAPVVMLGVAVSMAVNWTINERGHDEEAILRKKLPFLEGEAPDELHGVDAGDICDPMPAEAILHPEASVAQVEAALRCLEVRFFPIIEQEGSPCLGLLARPHLEGMHQAALTYANSGPADADAQRRARVAEEAMFPDTEISVNGIMRPDSLQNRDSLPIYKFMDATPFTILEETPALRLYGMFSKAGERAACVTSRSGEFRGIISREGLIDAARPRAH
eukprot:TRINITY_DN21474_c0_g1_i1.p1 TRINITY_DN21474_c0_g1~~TRINITY_DN21474_c0_g1_i1.p1  ORF type:complete len:749 (+),score=110.67 TRINITY_DN21474_c0_g1_i1:146-2392(+)